MRSEPVVAVPASQLNVCVECGAQLNGAVAPHACAACGRVQPLTASSSRDPFVVFGAERKFAQDRAVLQKRLFELSRALHPDRFARAADEVKQASLERMGLINEAYRLLNDRGALRDFLISESGLSEKASRGAEDLELAERWFELQEKVEENTCRQEKLGMLEVFERELAEYLELASKEMTRLEQDFDQGLGRGATSTLAEMVVIQHRSNTLQSMLRDLNRLKSRMGLS